MGPLGYEPSALLLLSYQALLFNFLLFMFFSFVCKNHTRPHTLPSLRGGRRGLEVVDLEGALEVEDRDLVRLRDTEKGAKRTVRVDVLTLHQPLLAGIADHRARHLAAAELRALGLAQEDTERIRDVVKLGEDIRLVGGRCTVGTDHRLAPTALVELLGGANHLALLLLVLGLDLLEGGNGGGDLLAERLVAREEGGTVLNDGGIRCRSSGRCNRSGGSGCYNGGRRSDGRCRGGGRGGGRGSGGRGGGLLGGGGRLLGGG